MTSDRDIERILDRWLTERPTQVADRVLDEVAERIARHPQQPAWRVSRRDIHVSTYLKPLLAVAAVIVIAVAGFAVLQPGGNSSIGGPSSPPASSPTSSPAAPSPSARAAYPAWYTGDQEGAGILPAGEATTRSFKPGTPFNVPEGWVNNLDVPIAYALFPDTPANEAEYALSGDTAVGIFMVSLESPYFFCEAWEKIRGTAAERVAFLAASEAFAVSEPVDVTIGGLTGKQVDVQLDPGWTETCPGDPPTADLSGWRNRLTYLDTPDDIIAIGVGSKHADGHEAFLAEAMPIIESFQFSPTP